MRLVRIRTPQGPRHGLLDGEDVVLTRALTDQTPTGERLPLAGATLLSPVAPRMLIGMAHNTGPEDRRRPPQAFFKPVSSVVGPDAVIPLQDGIGLVEAEAELAIVIGQPCRNLTTEAALDVVLGWTVANDVTARDLQIADPLWVTAKGYDGFTPLGPWIETDPPGLRAGGPATLTLSCNGRTVSQATTEGLARGGAEILSYLTSFMTLDAGDVILTGAPGRCAPLQPGDTVAVHIEGVGRLENPVTTTLIRPTTSTGV